MLPIYEHHDRIIETIRSNQVTIVVGETGSGKTTQLPRYIYEAGLGKTGVIGITEPRRMAATSVAKFVAEQLSTQLGDVVGYQVRFDDRTATETAIKFMTDGILLREMQIDPDLSRYSVIMVDEAHERSVNIDLTLGLLKELLTRRPDLRLVVSSATIDTRKFSRYFDNAPVVQVSGRTYPVDIVWGNSPYQGPEQVVQTIFDIHDTEPDGDILVFMTGVDDITAVIEGIEAEQERSGVYNLVPFPAHGGLSPEDQNRVFDTFPGARKVIVATNIAETSITIDGVVYVIDTGMVKETHFHPESGIQSLDVVLHSQAGCNQRAGRAGRTRPGVCYRLYTEDDFDRRPQYTQPELHRMSLAGVVLTMEVIGIKDIERFDFVDAPERAAFHEAYETLISLGAVTKDGDGLTDLGHKMARLPLEPRIARMVLAAEQYGCVAEIATVASFLSARNVLVRPKGKEYEADAAHRRFKVAGSDMLVSLAIWEQYEVSGFDRGWCRENFVSSRTLWEIKSIREQLLSILTRHRLVTSGASREAVTRSVAAGLINNLMWHRPFARGYDYSGQLRDLEAVFIHPGSSAFGRNPEWLVAAEIVHTSKRYARGVSTVQVEWLPELAPNHFYYGSTSLTSFDEVAEVVIGKRPIMKRKSRLYGGEDEEVGSARVEVSVEEARKIQERQIAQARADGMVELTFFNETTRHPSFGWEETKFFAYYGDVKCEVDRHGTITLEDNMQCYCLVEEKVYGPGFIVRPKYKPLALPEPAAVVVEEEPVDSENTVSARSAAKLLQEAWGSR